MTVYVRVTVNAKKETVTVVTENKLAISVKVKAQHNEANERIVVLVARHFKVEEKNVRIVRGHKSASKVLMVRV